MPPEPCRDQETISSFKRTLNAALLIIVTRRGNARQHGTVLTTVAVLVGWHFHADITALLF